MKVYMVEANAQYIGAYEAESENNALDLYAQDAGYENYAEQASQFGDDAIAVQIDQKKLFSDLSNETGFSVFQDSYGEAVALAGGIRFETYEAIASYLQKEIGEYKL